MKFLVTKELKHNQLLRLVLLFLVGTFFIFLFSDMLLHHYQIGLSLEKAKETILGNEEAFIEPLLFDVLLERVHMNIFTSMIVLMVLSIIYMKVYNTQTSKLIHFAFLSAIFAPMSLILSYFYGTFFIILWIVLFLSWHFCGFYFSLTIIGKLVK